MEVLKFIIENVYVSILIGVMALTVALLFGVMIGNATTLRLLTNLGIPVLTGNVEKDFKLVKSFNQDSLGWLSVPNTCYSPIMVENEGVYKYKNYLHREDIRGELYLAEDFNSISLTSIAKENNNANTFSDLSIIKGSSAIKSVNLRQCRFTLLRNYVNSDLTKHHPDIIVYDKGRKRIFNLLFAVELGIENRKKFKFSDRGSFITSLRDLSFYDTGRDIDNDIIILHGVTSIDATLVFLVEKEG